MVLAGLENDTQLRAKESGAQFRNEFLHRIGNVAKALAGLAIAAVGK